MAETVVEASGISKNYGAHKALDNASFRLEKGRIIGLIGPNGAGKTSLLKAILGLTPFQGEMSVLGQDPRVQRHKLMEQVCFIADVAVLPRWIRVRELLDYMTGVHPAFSKEKAETLLQNTKINMNSKVRELSKGMITQLHLAVVMAIDARLLVLDEPTLGLDIIYRKQFYNQLLNDYYDEHRTILITTHQVEEIEHVLSDVMFIKNGQIVLNKSLEEMEEGYTQVLVNTDKLEEARSLKPLQEQSVFGKQLLLYQGVDRETLAKLGETRRPGLADLFVAIMGDAQQ